MRHRRGFKALQATAEFLELSGEEMRAAIAEYTTIAEIAEANGSSGDAVIANLVGLVSDRLDEAVAEEQMTEDEAAEKLANAEERITNLVTSELPEPGDHPHRGGGGPGGFGGDIPSDEGAGA